MTTGLILLSLSLCLAATRTLAQSSNEMVKLKGSVISTGIVSGVTLANPHRFIRIDPPERSFTVRVESILPTLGDYTNGSLVSFSSPNQALYPTGMVRGATYDLVVLRKVERSAAGGEPFELQAPPKLVRQPVGTANRSQPVRPDTNRASGSLAASAPPKAGKAKPESYVYVSGGVRKPGRYGWTKGMTLVDAVNAAGGFTNSAPRKVRIFRFDGTSASYTLGGTNAPPILEAGDRISVPKRLF